MIPTLMYDQVLTSRGRFANCPYYRLYTMCKAPIVSN
jgi:hypothetical protein